MQLNLFDNKKLIISVYDYTGKWAEPYIQAGYPVMLWDKKIEGCILEGFSYLIQLIEETGLRVYGFLFAPPCTDTAVSGAQWWKEKDKPTKGYEPFINTTEFSIALFLSCLHMVDLFNPFFWALEQPVGRVEQLVPELKPYRKMVFNPCDYGDPYTKKTVLYGNFNTNLIKSPVAPEYIIWAGKKFPKIWAGTGGKSEKTKAIRSATPVGFANAFFKANQ